MESIDEFQEKETKTENQVGFIMSLAWDCIHVALFNFLEFCGLGLYGIFASNT